MAKPTGVCIVRGNGERIPVELIHDGYYPEADMDVWLIANAVVFPSDHLSYDTMPARTAIGFDTTMTYIEDN